MLSGSHLPTADDETRLSRQATVPRPACTSHRNPGAHHLAAAPQWRMSITIAVPPPCQIAKLRRLSKSAPPHMTRVCGCRRETLMTTLSHRTFALACPRPAHQERQCARYRVSSRTAFAMNGTATIMTMSQPLQTLKVVDRCRVTHSAAATPVTIAECE
jgi:hypothetical protein